MNTFKTIGIVLLAIAAAFIVRELFPKTKTVRTPPEIHTKWDTLEVVRMDTVEVERWRTRTRTVHDTVNLVREVVITQIDTMFVLQPLLGMIALNAQGEEWGDSLIIRGTEIWGDTSSIQRRDWRSSHFIAGPIRTIALGDSLPPLVEHWPMPPEPCGFWCKRKHELLGGAVGAGVTAIACSVR